jgi:hypothetical protein
VVIEVFTPRKATRADVDADAAVVQVLADASKQVAAAQARERAAMQESVRVRREVALVEERLAKVQAEHDKGAQWREKFETKAQACDLLEAQLAAAQVCPCSRGVVRACTRSSWPGKTYECA